MRQLWCRMKKQCIFRAVNKKLKYFKKNRLTHAFKSACFFVVYTDACNHLNRSFLKSFFVLRLTVISFVFQKNQKI